MPVATLAQAQEVLMMMVNAGLSISGAKWLLTSGYLEDIMEFANERASVQASHLDRDDFRNFLGLSKVAPDLRELPGIVLPDRSVTLCDRIVAGDYNAKIGPIEKRFSLMLPPGPRNLVLAHFKKMITTQKVLEWAMENDYGISPIDDLLAVGSHAEYHHLQLFFPIIALGSIGAWCNRQVAPTLGKGEGAIRSLYMSTYQGRWLGDYRFLLFRN